MAKTWYELPPPAMDPCRDTACVWMWQGICKAVDVPDVIQESVFVTAIHVFDAVLSTWLNPEPVDQKPSLSIVAAAAVALSAKMTCAASTCDADVLLKALADSGHGRYELEDLWNAEKDLRLKRCRQLGFTTITAQFSVPTGTRIQCVPCAGEAMLLIEGCRPFPVRWTEPPDERLLSGACCGAVLETANRFDTFDVVVSGETLGQLLIEELQFVSVVACHFAMRPRLIRSLEKRCYVTDLVFAFRETSDVEEAIEKISNPQQPGGRVVAKRRRTTEKLVVC